MNEPKSYIDIGHYPDHEHSAIWKLSWRHPVDPAQYSKPYIEAVSARTRTHETTWGQEAIDSWRGRFDTQTKQASVVGPVDGKPLDDATKNRIVKLLVEEFGTDITIWLFPGGVKLK